MLERVAIGSRLKELRKKSKFSQHYVAENLFISQAAYSLIETSQNGIIAEHIISLSNLYEVTTDYILKGDNSLIRISVSKGFIPYIKVKAHAGYIQNKPGNITAEDYEWFRIPGFNPTINHRLFEIEGESMIPTVYPGDIVIVQKQKNWENILDGSLVVVTTKKSLLVKRFRKGKKTDIFHFENDNPDEQEVLKFNTTEIQEIMMIRGKISNIIVSPHHLVGNSKLQTMEESIEFLKKELFAINKKLNSLKN